MQEVWKTITEFGDKYQISNFGNVKSLKRNNEKKLKPSLDHKGYLRFGFYHNSKNYYKKAHQLVAIYFLNHKPCGMNLVVDHINGIRTDNRVDNIQVISNRENCQKRIANHSSKYVGVCWCKRRNKFFAQIYIGKKIKIGYFDCEVEASKAYINKLKEFKNANN